MSNAKRAENPTTPAVTIESAVEEALEQGVIVPAQTVAEEAEKVAKDAVETDKDVVESTEVAEADKPKKFEYLRGLAKKHKRALIGFGAAFGTIVVIAVANAVVAAGRPSEELVDENPYAETNEVEDDNPEA